MSLDTALEASLTSGRGFKEDDFEDDSITTLVDTEETFNSLSSCNTAL